MNALTGQPIAAPMTETRFAVEGMHCAGCIARIEGALGKMSGVAAARVNFSAHLVVVRHGTDLTTDRIADVIERLGFPTHLMRERDARDVHDESRALMKAMAVDKARRFQTMDELRLALEQYA